MSFCRGASFTTVGARKWDVAQVPFRESNASGGLMVLLLAACWAQRAAKVAILDASLLQGAAKQSQQKEFGHFVGQCLVNFWSLFLTLLSLFFVTFVPDSFCDRVTSTMCLTVILF